MGASVALHHFTTDAAVAAAAAADGAAPPVDDEDGGAEAAPRPPSGGSPQAPAPAPDADDLRGVLAAQLRGRGLLAVGPVQLPSGVTGTVLSKAGGGEGGLEVLATFGSVHEWRHEHEVRTVRKRDLGREGLMRRAGDWIGIARSVHDPL